MQGRTPDFDATVQKPHTAVVQVQVIQGGQVVLNLEPHAGSVTADRTAAQMRTFEFEVIDRDGTLAPTEMTSVLAPFGSRIQVYRGVRKRSVSVRSVTYGGQNSWIPQTPIGQSVSLKVDSDDGSLTLGP